MVQMEHGIRGVVLKWFKSNIIVLGEWFSTGSNGTLY